MFNQEFSYEAVKQKKRLLIENQKKCANHPQLELFLNHLTVGIEHLIKLTDNNREEKDALIHILDCLVEPNNEIDETPYEAIKSEGADCDDRESANKIISIFKLISGISQRNLNSLLITFPELFPLKDQTPAEVLDIFKKITEDHIKVLKTQLIQENDNETSQSTKGNDEGFFKSGTETEDKIKSDKRSSELVVQYSPS